MVGIYFKRLFGLVALVLGVAIIGWFIYNQFHPTPEFKRSKRSVFQLILPAVMVFVGWRWVRYDGKGIEETPADFDSPELVESVARAKSTLGFFIEKVIANVDQAYVKFPIQTPAGNTEHIWGYVHSYREGQFNVTLANDPFDSAQSREGRRDVSENEVEDWQIMEPDGRIKGAQSLIALFRHYESGGKTLSPKMRKQKAQLIDA